MVAPPRSSARTCPAVVDPSGKPLAIASPAGTARSTPITLAEIVTPAGDVAPTFGLVTPPGAARGLIAIAAAAPAHAPAWPTASSARRSPIVRSTTDTREPIVASSKTIRTPAAAYRSGSDRVPPRARAAR